MRSSGEERLATALERDLKPPWRMYRNVAWLEKRPGNEPQDGEADLVLAHPDRGVMVIEVKGGGIECRHGEWYGKHEGEWERIRDPFAQAVDHTYDLRRKLGDSRAVIETVRGVGYRMALSGSDG